MKNKQADKLYQDFLSKLQSSKKKYLQKIDSIEKEINEIKVRQTKSKINT